MSTTKTRPVGRPRQGKTVMPMISIRIPEDMIAAVDRIVEERFGQADRSAVIRELIAQSLAARSAPRKPKG